MLRDEEQLDPYQVELVDKVFDWFNEHVPCPPFETKLRSGEWSKDAVAWFVPSANEAIQRMWELVAILRDHNMPVRVIRSESPGLIVYRDDFQVVAETPKRGG